MSLVKFITHSMPKSSLFLKLLTYFNAAEIKVFPFFFIDILGQNPTRITQIRQSYPKYDTSL